MKADRVALSCGSDAETPGLDIDAAIPESGFGCGDGYVDGGGDVEADPVVAGGGMGYINGAAINSDREGCGLQFRRDRRSLNAGGSMEGNGKRENSDKERAKYLQEARPQQESGNETTLAPGRRRRC